MCGIFSVFLPGHICDPRVREKAFQLSRRQRHRGPDSTGVQSGTNFAIVQERLSIIGLATGKQPLLNADESLILAANGEVYNYKALAQLISLRRGAPYNPRSDSDVILALFEEFGADCASMMWGMFGFVIYNKETGKFFACRDRLGLCSLYYGVDKDGRFYIASEMKCIPCENVQFFPPGHYVTGNADEWKMVEYYRPQWARIISGSLPADDLALKLKESVHYHMSADVPLAVFLSGGVSSSIVAYLAQQELPEGEKLKTFTVGLADSPDILAARKVAAHLGTDHTEIIFTPEEGIDLIHELIWHLETYDPVVIRDSIPMYILSRAARSCGIKVILSGDGANEIFAGYPHFKEAPDAESFHSMVVEGLMRVHLGDGLRANKATMAQSVELRAPFIGSPFVNYAMHIDTEERMPRLMTIDGREQLVGKCILRESFAHVLPEEIVNRLHMPFSLGVGAEWPKALTAYAEAHVTDEEFANHPFTVNEPTSKEAYYYRCIFDMEYSGSSRALTVSEGPNQIHSNFTNVKSCDRLVDIETPEHGSVLLH